jgi:hypothetical protein
MLSRLGVGNSGTDWHAQFSAIRLNSHRVSSFPKLALVGGWQFESLSRKQRVGIAALVCDPLQIAVLVDGLAVLVGRIGP